MAWLFKRLAMLDKRTGKCTYDHYDLTEDNNTARNKIFYKGKTDYGWNNAGVYVFDLEKSTSIIIHKQ